MQKKENNFSEPLLKSLAHISGSNRRQNPVSMCSVAMYLCRSGVADG